MNAIQPSRPPLKPVETRPVAPRPHRRRRDKQVIDKQVMALEVTVKIAVNVLLSAAAVSALVQLLPYTRSQQEKLGEIQTEVKLIQGRVNRLQTDFSRYFDPQQAKSIMQEQSNQVEPGQLQVILLNKAATKVEASAQSKKR